MSSPDMLVKIIK